MKNLIKVLISVIVVSILFNSCKKEEEDSIPTITNPTGYFFDYIVDGKKHELKNLIDFSGSNVWSATITGGLRGDTYYEAIDLDIYYDTSISKSPAYHLVGSSITLGSAMSLPAAELLLFNGPNSLYHTTEESTNFMKVTSVEYLKSDSASSPWSGWYPVDVYTVRGSFESNFYLDFDSLNPVSISGSFFMPMYTLAP